ncbi:Hypothetical predicted protein [Paramuricea clavata]|uniref:Uncharacterized protein n=1 Tax=Paramuricea clavata TaxID=317549 RepID=A0A7D9E9Z7_PARCT|nr:Hypothetical predicted protein [Paramuricea clavata]
MKICRGQVPGLSEFLLLLLLPLAVKLKEEFYITENARNGTTLFRSPRQAVANQGCPKGWKNYDNSCYLLVMRKMNWGDSRANCLAYGGDMVSILDSSEVRFIYQQTSAIKISRFWIGLIRTKMTSDPKDGWIWSDGNNITYPLQWGPGEPNNDQNNEHCAEILPGKSWWNDNDCAREYASICKRKKDYHHWPNSQAEYAEVPGFLEASAF